MNCRIFLLSAILLSGCAGTSRFGPLPFEGADAFSSCQQLASLGSVED